MTKAVMMFCLGSTAAFAGTVHFDPPSATIMPGTPSVSFEVSVSTQVLSSFDSVSIIVIADDGVDLQFEYAQSFVDSSSLPPPEPFFGLYNPCPTYGCGPPAIGFGGNNFSQEGWTSPLLVGTLTVDTTQFLAGNLIELEVDPFFEADLVGSAISLVGSGVNQEPVAGMATITVVPEPGTIGVLLAGSLAILGRKSMRRLESCDANPQPIQG